jgi:hypothetical protein
MRLLRKKVPAAQLDLLEAKLDGAAQPTWAVDFHAILTRHFHRILIHPYFSFEGSRCG